MNPTGTENAKRGRKAIPLTTKNNVMKIRLEKGQDPIEVSFSLDAIPSQWSEESLHKLAEASVKVKIRSSILQSLKSFDAQLREAIKMRDAAMKMMKISKEKAEEFFQTQGYYFERPTSFEFSEASVMNFEEEEE